MTPCPTSDHRSHHQFCGREPVIMDCCPCQGRKNFVAHTRLPSVLTVSPRTYYFMDLTRQRRLNAGLEQGFGCKDLGPHAPQGSTPLLPKLSVTSKVRARTSYGWVGSRVHFRSSEDVILLEFTSPIDRGYMRRRRKCH